MPSKDAPEETLLSVLKHAETLYRPVQYHTPTLLLIHNKPRDPAEISSIHEKIASAVRDLRVVDDNMAAIWRLAEKQASDRARLQEYIDGERYQLAPIHLLPNEVLSIIFQQVVHSDNQKSLPTSRAQILMSVCRRWDAVAVNTQGLWSTLFLQTSVTSPTVCDTWLKRSGHYPLTLQMIFDIRMDVQMSQKTKDLSRVFAPHSHRIRTLNFVMKPQMNPHMKSFLGAFKELSSLQFLEVHMPGFWQPSFETLNLAAMPALRRFVFVSDSYSPIQHTEEQVRWYVVPSITMNIKEGIAGEDLRSLLTELSPVLEYGDFTIQITEEPAGEKVMMPRLHTLRLVVDVAELDLRYFFSTVSTPQLKSLTLDGRHSFLPQIGLHTVTAVAQMLAGTNLKSLSLFRIEAITTESLKAFLASTPHLEHLLLFDGSMLDGLLIEAMINDGTNGVLLPKLTAIEFQESYNHPWPIRVLGDMLLSRSSLRNNVALGTETVANLREAHFLFKHCTIDFEAHIGQYPAFSQLQSAGMEILAVPRRKDSIGTSSSIIIPMTNHINQDDDQSMSSSSSSDTGFYY